MKGKQSEYDLAYASFLLCGLTALFISAMDAIPMDSGTAGGLGFLVAIPLSFASLLAMVLGIVLSVRLKDWSLVVLSAMSLVIIAAVVIGTSLTLFILPFVYGIVVVAISGRWFLVLRRRRFPQL